MSEQVMVPEVTGDRGSFGAAAEMVASGATLMRIENETMMSVAVQRPRAEERILKDALKELELVPSLAARCYYAIPYKQRKNGKEETVWVMGASVNAARNLARRWGNCSVKTMLTSEDDDKVVLAGVFIDLETNFREERLFVVSKWQHRRDGRPVRLSNERLAMAVQAGASKAERNAILAGLPDWLKHSYYERARTIAAKEAREKISVILEAFLTEGVTRDMLERHFGKSISKLEEEDLSNLRGMLNALRDGEATPETMFGTRQGTNGANGSNGGAQSTASVDDVLAAGATTTGGAEKSSEKPAPAPEQPQARAETRTAKSREAKRSEPDGDQGEIEGWFGEG